MNYTIDLDSKELSIYRLTSEVQLYRYNEPEPGLFIAESAKVIMRSLDCGYEPISLLYDKNQLHEELQQLLKRLDNTVPVYESDTDTLKNITGFNLTRGVLCAMRRRPLPALDKVCAAAKRIAILDNIENPTNVGAIFRSAAAMGIDALLLTSECADPLYRRAIRVSMGNVFLIPWTILKKGEDYIAALKKMGYTTIAMALREDSLSIDAKELKALDKIAIILGNEGEGLSAETIKNSDHTVMIPMMNGVDSLNVAAASAVAFWELK